MAIDAAAPADHGRAPRQPAWLRAEAIACTFPGVRALDGVDLALHRGEVLALVGENGAGKSTLMKVLAGAQQPDAGTLYLDGERVQLGSVADALRRGIALIHQELNLCDNLSVGANVMLGREPRRRLGLLDGAALERQARAALARVGLDVDPARPLRGLSVGQRQLVEIARALAVDARALVMDEPTASLGQAETERLLATVRELRAQGVGVLYVSHRLGEVEAIADRVVVLRDGRLAGELTGAQIGHDAMVARMVGRELGRLGRRTAQAPGAPCLRARGVRTQTYPGSAVDLTLRAGEVVALAGLVGAGRSELLRALFGIDARVGGEVLVGDRTLPGGDVRAAIAAGLALVPEDRKAQGLLLDEGVAANLSLPGLARTARAGVLVDFAAERRLAADAIDRLRIKTPHAAQPVRLLSGGNQQKVVLGKWLAMHPRVLLLDEPTRGIDVGAKAEVYGLIDRLAGEGIAVLFASSEMEEVLALADRVLVMCEGRLAGELTGDEVGEHAILQLAAGAGAARRPA